jgi:hypothetical protein
VCTCVRVYVMNRTARALKSRDETKLRKQVQIVPLRRRRRLRFSTVLYCTVLERIRPSQSSPRRLELYLISTAKVLNRPSMKCLPIRAFLHKTLQDDQRRKKEKNFYAENSTEKLCVNFGAWWCWGEKNMTWCCVRYAISTIYILLCIRAPRPRSCSGADPQTTDGKAWKLEARMGTS